MSILNWDNSGAALIGVQYGKAPSKSAENISMINTVIQRPWTSRVCRDRSLHGQFHGKWKMALRPEVSGIAVDVQLFHEAGSRLVHKYRVYKDPLPNPALRGGVIPKLLSFVGRAMAIAQLTQLRISIPSSGAPTGKYR